MVGSVSNNSVLTTEADNQSSLHCVTVSTDVTSDDIGRCSMTSAYSDETAEHRLCMMHMTGTTRVVTDRQLAACILTQLRLVIR